MLSIFMTIFLNGPGLFNFFCKLLLCRLMILNETVKKPCMQLKVCRNNKTIITPKTEGVGRVREQHTTQSQVVPSH